MIKARGPRPSKKDGPSSEAGAEDPALQSRPSGFHRTGEEPSRPRWTVIEEFVRDGFFYQVKRRPVTEPEPALRLTRREKQVLSFLLDGHSTKSIAYCLGLSPSTVGVLVFRAAGKLGVKSRRELLCAYERMRQGGK